jgi:hypothetical protein
MKGVLLFYNQFWKDVPVVNQFLYAKLSLFRNILD